MSVYFHRRRPYTSAYTHRPLYTTSDDYDLSPTRYSCLNTSRHLNTPPLNRYSHLDDTRYLTSRYSPLDDSRYLSSPLTTRYSLLDDTRHLTTASPSRYSLLDDTHHLTTSNYLRSSSRIDPPNPTFVPSSLHPSQAEARIRQFAEFQHREKCYYLGLNPAYSLMSEVYDNTQEMVDIWRSARLDSLCPGVKYTLGHDKRIIATDEDW